MTEVISMGLVSEYTFFMSQLPSWVQSFISLFLLVLVVFVYALVVWHGYRFIARKDLLELNLNKYNKSSHRLFSKFFASLFFFLEYIIISPLIIFAGFVIFTTLLLVLNESLAIGTLLLVSSAIIGAVRIASYYKEDLARELSKFLPFTLLGVSVLNPNFFNFEKILEQIVQIPTFFSNITIYLLFIIVLEIILRFFDFIFSLFGLEEEPIETEEKN